MNLSGKIQLCRKRAGLSQEALAERLGVSRQAVSKWETGAAEPDLSKLRQLAAAFDVTADWLLSDDDVQPNAGASAASRFTSGDASSSSADQPSDDRSSGGANPASASPDAASSEDSSTGSGSASSTAENSSRDNPAPNWVESVPGVLGRLLRQYGWLVGLRMAVSGALMTSIGILGRLAVRSMNQSFSIDASDLWIPSETAWYDEAGNLITSAGLTTRQPSDPVTLLCTGMIVLGVILIVAGACIAVSLKLRDKK